MSIILNAHRTAKPHYRAFLAMFLIAAMMFGALPVDAMAQYLGDMPISGDNFSTITIGSEESERFIPQPMDGVTIDIGYYEYGFIPPIIGANEGYTGFDPFIISPIPEPWEGPVDMYNHPFSPANPVRLSPLRYQINNPSHFNGRPIEIFCADPHRPGPENPAATGWTVERWNDAPAQLVNALRFGYPNAVPGHTYELLIQGNPPGRLSNPSTDLNFTRYRAYATRIAVALGVARTHPLRPNSIAPTGARFGQHQLAEIAISLLEDANAAQWYSTTAVLIADNPHMTSPVAQVAADNSASYTLPMVQRYWQHRGGPEPLMISWMAGTPAGTRLYADNVLIATAPNNPAQPYIGGSANLRLFVPNADEHPNGSAGIYLNGINNINAGVWTAVVPQDSRPLGGVANSGNTNAFQTMVFYIPMVEASFSMRWEMQAAETGSLRIYKEDMQGNRLAGAQFRITGPDPSMPMYVTVPAEGWTSDELQLGWYYIEEIMPPPGHILASPSVSSVLVTADHTATSPAVITIHNYPITVEPNEGFLRIYKEDLQGNRLSGALFNVTGPDPSMPMNNVNVPASGFTIGPVELGVYTITEIQPPPNFSLASNNTQTVTLTEANNTAQAAAIVTFTNAPTSTPAPTPAPTPPPADPGVVIIQKVDALSRENIPGALVRLRGMSANTISLPDGQIISINNTGINISQVLTAGVPTIIEGENGGITSTVSDGLWILEGLPYGMYVVYEERAPDGYSILPQHTAFGFWVAPPDVAVSMTETEPGEITVTISGNATVEGGDGGAGGDGGGEGQGGAGGEGGEGGSAELELEIEISIPTDLFAPPSFEIVLTPVATAVSIVFENYPFSEVVVYKRCSETNAPLSGAVFRIEGFFVEGNAPQIIDMTAVTDSSGRLVFSGLPAGGYTVSEVSAPAGFLLDNPNFQHINVSWGQLDGHATRPAPTLSFFNTPLAYIELTKVDGDNPSVRLPNAVFRLTGPNQHGDIVTQERTTDSNGIARWENLLPGAVYVLEEISPPAGFILMDGTQTIITTTGRNEVTWRNWRSPGLTIVKLDYDTGVGLAGAVFEVTAQGSGSPFVFDFPLVTDSSGRIFIPNILFEGEAERTFVVREVLPPLGFTLSDNNVQTVTLLAGADNNQTVTFHNRRYPDIIIVKTDARTNEPINGAVFSVERLSEPNRGYVTGSPFTTGIDPVTGAAGIIRLPSMPPGQYRITEIAAANGYWLDPMEQNRSMIINLLPNQDFYARFYNTLLPTLIVTKFNMLTMRPVPLTHFRIEHEVPNSANVVHVGNFVTDHNGQIVLPLVPVGWYRITEIFPAPGMSLNQNNSYRTFLSAGDYTYQILHLLRGESGGLPGATVSDADVPNPTPNPNNPGNGNNSGNNDPLNVNPIDVSDFPYTPQQWEQMSATQRQAFFQGRISIDDGTGFMTGTGIFNWPLNSIIVRKICSVTGQLLPNAQFSLTHISAGVSGNVGTVIGTFTTNSSGVLVITGLVPGTYAVTETRAPAHFTLSANNTQHAFLQPDGHSIVMLDFVNDPFGSLLITKRCEITRQPLYNAEFRVTRSDGSVVGTANGYFSTNLNGEILIPNLPPDTFVVTEIRPPDGFRLTGTPRTIRVNATGQTYRLDFTNQPYSTLYIQKFDSFDNSPIQGAHFEVRHADGRFVGEFITDVNGLIRIPEVLGWFTVTETRAPDGFALDPNPTRLVNVRAQAPELIRFFNPRLGSLTIEKTDQHGAPLAGAQFRITTANGTFLATHTTNASGLITLTDLTAGFYFVEEIRAPQGFIISEPGRFVEVSNNAAAITTFMNLEQPTLTIIKVCDDGNPLSGARFRVTHIGGSFREYVTTGAGGVASLVVPVGTLEIVEVQAPAGFVITEPARTVVSRAGEHRTEAFVNHRIPSLVIEKTDTQGNPLQGAEFEIRRLDGGLVTRVTTNSGGIATVAQIEAGTFQVIESRAPQGFVLDSTAQIVTLTAGQTSTVRFVNERIPMLTIEKVDETGLPLAGAVFEIRTVQGQLIAEVTTNSGGLAIVAELPPGVYQIIETVAPQGFVLTERARIIEVFAGQIRRERFVNYSMPSLVIEKVDGDGNPLQGAEFEVRRMDGGLVQRVTTNNSGVAVIAQIAPGMYQVFETRAPEGFVLNSNAQFVNIQAGQNATLRFVNLREPSLIIEKVDGNGLPLAGATFEVRTLTGALVAEVVTNQGGLAIVPNLTPGAYEIIETIPPAGYVIVARSRVVEFVAGQSTTVRFVNLRQPGLVIEKVDEAGLPLSGAEFELRTVGGLLLHRVTTGQGGIAVIEGLETGTFILTETRPPQGFEVVEISRTIEFVAGQSQVERFVNLRTPSLVIEKLDNYGNPLQGAEFEIRTLQGALVQRVTTNSGGIAAVELSPGTVQVIETRSPQGFVLDSNAQIIEIRAGESASLRFVNYRQPIIIIEKVDTDGNPLQGAEFEVRRMDGALVARVTTNSGGTATVAQMDVGTFEIVETRPPQGFVLDSVSRFVTLTAGQTATIRFVNHRLPSVIIEKVDIDGNPLANAEFEIRTLGGELVLRAVTNSGGLITVPHLAPGSYQIIETRAPEGFVITEPARAIEVRAGETRTERFINHRAPALIIEKVCTDGQPLAGAEFEIRTLAGLLVERVVTNQGGMAIIAELPPGSFEITETRAPDGFALIEGSRAIQIVAGQTVVERFINPRLATLVIQKIDGVTSAPLQGVIFEVSTLAGNRLPNHINNSFEFVTDSAGLLRLPNLPAGTWVITETRPLAGYMAADPVVFAVGVDNEYLITIRNYRYPDYVIRKVDGVSGEPLAGVQFELARYFADGRLGSRLRNPQDGSFIWTTDNAGLIRIPNLEHGTFVAIETRPLPGYQLADPVIFVVDDHHPTTITIPNFRYSEWNIRKLCGDTNRPLAGVVFEVSVFHGTGTTGDRMRNTLDGSFEFVTDAAGIARIGALPPNTYIITETRALPGYIAADPVIITVTGREVDTTVTIRNYKMATYVIRKIDGDTNQPLRGVVFEIAHYFGNGNAGERIRNPLNGSFEFVTDAAGLITIPHLPQGTFIAIETRALQGYDLAEPVVFVISDTQDTTITIRNYRRPNYVVRKIDGDTGLPLQGVVFELARFFGADGATGTTGERIRNPINGGFEFITDAQGIIRLPQLETGVTFILTETRPLAGYTAAEPFIFTVGDNVDTSIVIRNYRKADFAIIKIDGDTRQPLRGVEFEIAHYLGQGRNGERLINPANGTTTFVTNAAGMINLPSLAPGQYVAIETRPLPGFSTAEPVVFIVGNENQVVTIHNYRLADWIIRKTDGDTGRPLAGVHFEISRYFGSGQVGERLRNPLDGSSTFITDWAGLIRLSNLSPGTYIAIETRALPGYILAEPVIFVVAERAENTTIDIQNFRAPNLTIRKINSITRQPIQGVVFEIARINGERIMNPRTGLFDFVTDRNGLIHLPAMEDGTFLVTETRPAQGYFGLDEAVVLEINSETRQREYLLVIENTPASGLMIRKTDAHTGQPLQGVEFEVRHADGRLVRGLMADQNQPGTAANSPNIAPNGNFVTDHRGIIHLAHLEAGVFHITETRALPGYLLDSTVHVVTITAGRLTTLEVANEQMAGLRLFKVDSVTRQGIPGVEFRIFDFTTNREVAGPFITDNRGIVEFTGILPAGRYIIRETQAAPGFLLDTMPRTIELRAGMVTQITWENTREAGQIQITKLSSADNQINGLPASSRLAGAVFEVRDWRTGNVVDQFVTDARGVGVSRPLPLGRYLIEEIVAPPFYLRSDVVLDVTIEHSGQILRFEFFNEPANVGVEVRKIGPVEVMPGQPIVWNITTIANSSNVALSDFFVRDVLPAHAVRLDRIFTGTFNQSLRYSVMFRTNLNDTWRVAYDNLLSTTNNALVMSPAALGLRPNEFVTEIMYSFGTVRAGFRSVVAPRIEGTVRDGLQNGYEFVNRLDAGGRIGDEWVIGNNLWVTRTFRPTHGQHPRTGW